MRLAPIAYPARLAVMICLAGCQRLQPQVVSGAVATNAPLVSAQPQNSKSQEDWDFFKVWGYAAPKSGEAHGAARNILEASARADAQQMLTLAVGVAFEASEKGVKYSGGSMVSMVVREIRTTPTNCLVQAEGPVRPIIPNGMRSLKTVTGVAPLARSKFAWELLNAANKALDGAMTGQSNKRTGLLVLRKMEYVTSKEPPQCRYEADVYTPRQ